VKNRVAGHWVSRTRAELLSAGRKDCNVMLSPHLLDLLRELGRLFAHWRPVLGPLAAALLIVQLRSVTAAASAVRSSGALLAGWGGRIRTFASAIGVPLSSLLSCLAERADRAPPAGVDRSPPLPPHGSVAPNGHIRDAKARILPPQPASRGAARQVRRAVRVCGRRNARRANDADGRLRAPETPPYAKAKTMRSAHGRGQSLRYR
jgi:hypothetical protein